MTKKKSPIQNILFTYSTFKEGNIISTGNSIFFRPTTLNSSINVIIIKTPRQLNSMISIYPIRKQKWLGIIFLSFGAKGQLKRQQQVNPQKGNGFVIGSHKQLLSNNCTGKENSFKGMEERHWETGHYTSRALDRVIECYTTTQQQHRHMHLRARRTGEGTGEALLDGT